MARWVLFDREHSILFSADQIIDGIVPIVATAYMNEHLLSLYFQSLESFEKHMGADTGLLRPNNGLL